MPSAAIVRARLPAGLERLRRTSVGDAAEGVPAHLTLLDPFAQPGELARAVRRRLAASGVDGRLRTVSPIRLGGHDRAVDRMPT